MSKRKNHSATFKAEAALAVLSDEKTIVVLSDFERACPEVRENGMQSHIRSRGEEAAEKSHPVRRWVVEPTFAWLKGFGAIARGTVKGCATTAMVHFACAAIISGKIPRHMQ